MNGSTPIGPGETRTVQLADLVSVAPLVPTNATGVQLRLVAVNPSQHSHLVVTANGSTATSNLNVVPGVTRSNSVTVPLSGGDVKVFNAQGTTDLIIDIEGYIYPDWSS